MSSEAVEAPGIVAGGICVKADDTGRVLLLRRGISADDPASGQFEFPGGHCEDGEVTLAAAQREWQEETGGHLPAEGTLVGQWTSGIYTGFIWLIPSESAIDINPVEPDVPNPDHGGEWCQWFSLDALPDTMRVEMATVPWDQIRAAGMVKMAYHPDRKQAALHAYKTHRSIRRAARAVGVPKSTVHDWVQRSLVSGPTQDVDDEPKPADEVVTDNERREERQADLRAKPGDAIPDVGLPSNLNPQNPDLPPTSAVGMGTNTQLEPDAPIVADPRTASRAGQSSLWTRADNPDFLRAFRRWVNLRSSGVSPQYAIDAVQQIDDDFEITRQEQDYVDQALGRMQTEGRFWMAERLVFDGPPQWLQDLVGHHRIDDPASLAGPIATIRREAYLAAINANLDALGLTSVSAITSQELLDRITKEAQESAAGIAGAYGDDLENVAGRLYLQAQSDPDTSHGASVQDKVAAGLDGWTASRRDATSGEVAMGEAVDAYNAGMSAFHQHNGAATGGYVEPTDCACTPCRDLLAMASEDNLMPTADLEALDLPLHLGAEHRKVYAYDDVWDTDAQGTPWSGQAHDDVA